MPDAVQDMLLQKWEAEGELEVLYEDYEDGSHKIRHFMNTEFGERLALHYAGKAPVNLTGDFVQLGGYVLRSDREGDIDADFAVAPDDNAILNLAAGGGSTGGATGGSEAAVPYTFGEQKTLVIMINFQDDPKQPFTKTEISNMIFGTVNDFIVENSFNQTWLSGTTTGWYTLPMNSSECGDVARVRDYAEQAASNAGINLINYQRIIYVHGSGSCPWSGLGTVGGNPSKANIASIQWWTIAHELGHNLGLYHSHALDCGNNVIGSNCSSLEYGDASDVMGGARSHYNAFQKDRLGWLDAETETVSSTGSYTIAPFANLSLGSKALKIPKGVDPNTGFQDWYYVEYRQRIGYDYYSNTIGVVIHSGSDSSGNSSQLLDMTPGSIYLFNDSDLNVGDQFSDNDTGISIETLAADSGQATVYVDVGSQTTTCVQANPTITTSPSTSAWVEAGTPVSFAITVTNTDNSACGTSSFNLGRVIPQGWTAAFAQNSLSIVPGGSATTTLTVTSTSTASSGFYDINVTATNGGYTAMSTITYVVDTPTTINSPPQAQNDTATTAMDTVVNIHVLDNDSDPDSDLLMVTTVSGVNGNAIIKSDGTVTYTPPLGFTGTETFVYTVSDGRGGSDSAQVTVSVQATSSNQAPVAVSDSAIVVMGSLVTIAVLSNDSDPDGDTLTIVGANQPAKGTVKINSNGTLTYTPAKNFKSSDSFTYTISDGQLTDTATVYINADSGGTSTGGGTKGGAKGKGPTK